MAGRSRTLAQFNWRVALILMPLVFTAIGMCASVSAACQIQWPKNSTEKRRVVPNSIASKAGSQIRWETDIDVAFKKSIASGKPVFWYVPRLPNTFMDRVKSLDVYMKACLLYTSPSPRD